jgi:hypothetical protein
MTTPPPGDDLTPAPRPRGRPPRTRRPPSANALRHGILSTNPVLPVVENEADWQAHLDGQIAALEPQGDLELVLAHRIALTLWRLNRLIGYERHILKPSPLYLSYLEDPRLKDAELPFPDHALPSNSIEDVQRYEAHLHRIFLKDLHELEALQTRRRGDPTLLARVEIN